MPTFRPVAPGPAHGPALEMRIQSVVRGTPEGGHLPVELATDRGRVACRSYPFAGSPLGVVWVSGVGGGWGTPALDLYPRLCRELQQQGVCSARVRFRKPGDLDESVLDTLAAAAYLESEGARALAFVGHSFGGAVVIRAAVNDSAARTVVALATQNCGTEPVGELAPRCSLLAVHGRLDTVLPVPCSEGVFRRAGEPKRLLLFSEAGHGLNEVAGQLRRAVAEWVVNALWGGLR